MRFLVQSAIFFFGTLMAAGLVALGAPGAFDQTALVPVHRDVAGHAAAATSSAQRHAGLRWAVEMADVQNPR